MDSDETSQSDDRPSFADWRYEKAANVIGAVCFMLEHTTEMKHASKGDPGYDMRQHFHRILWDATKLFCDAAGQRGAQGVGRTWSPELPQYLFDHPEKCEETLGIVSDKDYRDGYYDK